VKLFLVVAFLLSVVINFYQYVSNPKMANIVIASPSQTQCIRNRLSIENEANVIGPAFLSGYKALELNINSTDQFNHEISGCYFDSYVDNVTFENLADKVHFMRSTGNRKITFFKDENSETFTIYGQSK
jgi:hypothetical protein